MKKYFNLFDTTLKVDYKTEVLSGLTVALALVPEAVAFALIAGLSPITGLKKSKISQLPRAFCSWFIIKRFRVNPDSYRENDA